MATLRVILRFRELTPNVDTIKAHLDVIERDGSVFWGWWKKETEPDHRTELDKLRESVDEAHTIDAWLIDTTAERLHRASVTEIKARLTSAEKTLVPAYYRQKADEVPTWFRITRLDPNQPYDAKLEAKVGQNTLAIVVQ